MGGCHAVVSQCARGVNVGAHDGSRMCETVRSGAVLCERSQAPGIQELSSPGYAGGCCKSQASSQTLRALRPWKRKRQPSRLQASSPAPLTMTTPTCSGSFRGQKTTPRWTRKLRRGSSGCGTLAVPLPGRPQSAELQGSACSRMTTITTCLTSLRVRHGVCMSLKFYGCAVAPVPGAAASIASRLLRKGSFSANGE